MYLNKNKTTIVAKLSGFFILSALLFLGCVPPNETNIANNQPNLNTNTSANAAANANADANSKTEAAALGDDRTLAPEEVEQGRMDEEWKKFTKVDQPTEKVGQPNKEKWQDVTADNVNNQKQSLPLQGDVAGPSVFRVQTLLDLSDFSPGMIDGKWGKNTEKAVYWLQKRENLTASGQVDTKTYQRLIELAQKPDKLIVEQKLTEKDVAGPFKKIPSDIYEKAKQDCMCYESLEEKLSEMFHATPALLEQLNPKVKFDGLKAGDTINVPNILPQNEKISGDITELVVSDGGHFLHALDGQGKILAHFPSTLGSDYNPSPSGNYKINSITEDPWWHYQPELLDGGGGRDAQIPPGPNNAVGAIWMDLSKPHYGIHGTSAPETIGYATSHGCIRLTNWDALKLGRSIKAGVPVKFQDITGNRQEKKEAE